MPRNPGVSNVRATAPRSISGSICGGPPGARAASVPGVSPPEVSPLGVSLLGVSLPEVESIRRLSQRMKDSLEDPFDHVKQVFVMARRDVTAGDELILV